MFIFFTFFSMCPYDSIFNMTHYMYMSFSFFLVELTSSYCTVPFNLWVVTFLLFMLWEVYSTYNPYSHPRFIKGYDSLPSTITTTHRLLYGVYKIKLEYDSVFKSQCIYFSGISGLGNYPLPLIDYLTFCFWLCSPIFL